MKQMRHIRTGIHSVLMFHVGASDIKLAPIFFCKSQSTLTPLLLLSKSNPLRWAAIWFWARIRKLCHVFCLNIPRGCKVHFAATSFL